VKALAKALANSTNPDTEVISKAFETLSTDLAATAEEGRCRLRQAAQQAGSPEALIAARWPTLTRLSTFRGRCDLERLTEAELDAAEERVEQCEACPPEGAACREHRCCIERGQQIEWTEDGALTTAACARYPRYRLRVRLVRAGVPPRLAQQQFPSLEATEQRALGGFAASVVHGRDAWLACYGDPERASILAVKILAGILHARWRMVARYAHVNDFVRTLKDYFNQSRTLEDPRHALVQAELVVLDGVRKQLPTWAKEEVRDLLRQRWGAGRPTLVTLESEPTLAVMGLDGLPSCEVGT
jgi:hypothetical protein